MDEPGVARRARLLFAATLALAALGIGVWFFDSTARYSTYEIVTHEAVSGLERDAPVELHGVQVGRVRAIELIDAKTVRIVVAIERTAPISNATTAAVVSRGLSPKGFTGYVGIALEETGSDTGPLLARADEPHPTIPALPARDFSLDSEIRRANELARTLLDPATMAALRDAVQSFSEVTRTLAQNNERLDRLIVNSERASRQLGPLLKASDESIQAIQSQLLPEAYRALTELQNLTGALSGTAEEIGRDPSVLLRGRAQAAPAPGERR